MTLTRSAAALLVVVAVTSGGRAVVAQATASTYKVRLSSVPVQASTAASLTGSGSATGTLRGTTLTVTGTFEGLQTPATTARVHVAPKGIRGPGVLDLVVTKATKGSVSGELALTPAQVDDLRRGRLYIQIQSEKAPEGNLWGWLLP
jgi:hypothetical protein